MKLLIISSCTSKKKVDINNKLVKEDFIDVNKLRKRKMELQEYILPAREMYTGTQHLRLIEGIDLFRNTFKEDLVDLYILSAGYGFINEKDMIVPYEVTFNNMTSNETNKWAKFLNINKDLNKIIKKYDMIIFLLGNKYLKSLCLPLEEVNENQKLIFLASKTSKKNIPDKKNYYFLEIGLKDAKLFSYGLIGLKGYLMKLLFNEISINGINILNNIYDNPKEIMNILDKYKKF